jgi:hypothetical protein
VYKAGGVLAAVCHGPVGLVTVTDDAGVPVVRGKRVTCFSNAEESTIGLTEVVPFALETRLAELGGVFEAADIFKERVSVCTVHAVVVTRGAWCELRHVCWRLTTRVELVVRRLLWTVASSRARTPRQLVVSAQPSSRR